MQERLSKDRHHALWERREYRKRPVANQLRESRGLIVPMAVSSHRQLHMEMAPLPVMSDSLARVGLDHLRSMNHLNAFGHSVLELYDGVTEKFYAVSNQMGRIGLEAGMFAEHLEDQRAHMKDAY